MDWNRSLKDYKSRLSRIKPYLEEGKVASTKNIIALLEAAIKPNDIVCLEGDNQKQADFLARSLCQVNPQKVYGLHMVLSAVALPEHLNLFERKIAEQIDFSFAGPQATRLALMIQRDQIKIGNIHTYHIMNFMRAM